MSKEIIVTGDKLNQAAAPPLARPRHPRASLRSQLDARPVARPRAAWLTLIELALILLWAAVVVRPYLDFDPQVVPFGMEYLHHISPNHFWTRLTTCGPCALWNGGARGGYPALADLQGSALHPYVAVATLLFGVINGAKVMLFLAFATAGFAQWWLGRTLGLPRPIRLWIALMAVAGGHLAGRMEGGVPGLVLALAAYSLALAALVALIHAGTRRSAILFGVTFAMTLLAGQGYIQVGFAFLLPLALILIIGGPLPAGLIFRRIALGLGLAALLAAPLLLPALHFLPQFVKFTDPQFAPAQPLRFIALNLLIDDSAFYRTQVIGKMAFPSVYASFIGWIPLILAVWGVASRPITGSLRHGLYFAAMALGGLWLASAVPLKALAGAVPVPAFQNFLYGVRFSPFLTGLAVPPILALAGIGLARVARAGWPRFTLAVGREPGALRSAHLDLKWLLIIPLLFALRETYSFGREYIRATRLGDEVAAALDALATPDLQWVNTPFGEWYWAESAAARNLKVSLGTQPWNWAGREPPLPVRELSRAATPPPGMTLGGKVGDLYLYVSGPGREYAALTTAGGLRIPCRAQGVGGNIDITCDSPAGGSLTLLENNWPGWQARIDGKAVPIGRATFITVPLPAGAQSVALRYRPFDAFLGLAFMLIGVALALYLWLNARPAARPVEAA